MKPTVISASTRGWIDCKEQQYPQDDNAYPFWVTIEDLNCKFRRKELVVMTEKGLCFCETWHGEKPGNPITEKVTHWMPQDIPMYPAKF